MTKKDVDAHLAAAKNTADKASARLAQISQKRLTELLKLAPAERLSHIDDPALVPADRAAVRRSLSANLPRARRIPFPRIHSRQYRRWMGALARLLLTFELVIPTVVVAVWFAFAWHHTAYVATLTVDLRSSDGTLFRGGDPVVIQTNLIGRPQLRRWVTGDGYALFPLPSDTFKWGRPGDVEPVP